jgi:hypothetical protein
LDSVSSKDIHVVLETAHRDRDYDLTLALTEFRDHAGFQLENLSCESDLLVDLCKRIMGLARWHEKNHTQPRFDGAAPRGVAESNGPAAALTPREERVRRRDTSARSRRN